MPKGRISMPFSRHRLGRLRAGLVLAAASAGLVTAATVGPAAAAVQPVTQAAVQTQKVSTADTLAAKSVSAHFPASGTYFDQELIKDVKTLRCLDSNATGNVYTNPCWPGDSYQEWDLYQYIESLPTTTVYFYAFKDVATGRCLDSNAAGNLYTTHPCQAPGNTYQDWVPMNPVLGDSYFDYATGRCLDSNATGNAYTLPCNGGPYQEWSFP